MRANVTNTTPSPAPRPASQVLAYRAPNPRVQYGAIVTSEGCLEQKAPLAPGTEWVHEIRHYAVTG